PHRRRGTPPPCFRRQALRAPGTAWFPGTRLRSVLAARTASPSPGTIRRSHRGVSSLARVLRAKGAHIDVEPLQPALDLHAILAEDAGDGRDVAGVRRQKRDELVAALQLRVRERGGGRARLATPRQIQRLPRTRREV